MAVLQGRFMAVNFASDLQAELDYFAGPKGMGVDGMYTDCTRTTSEWLQLMCAVEGSVFIPSEGVAWACPLAVLCLHLVYSGNMSHTRTSNPPPVPRLPPRQTDLEGFPLPCHIIVTLLQGRGVAARRRRLGQRSHGGRRSSQHLRLKRSRRRHSSSKCDQSLMLHRARPAGAVMPVPLSCCAATAVCITDL